MSTMSNFQDSEQTHSTHSKSEDIGVPKMVKSSAESSNPPAEGSFKQETPPHDTDTRIYPTGLTLVLIFVSLCTTTFLVALDGTIIATAIPTITAQFNSLDQVSWYNASYLLATCCFQLPFGRAYTLLNMKWVYVFSIVVFMVGSLVCATAPSSVALIIRRAIAGAGGSGIFGGGFILIAKSTPLRKRSLFTGFIGGTFVIASAIGPILGKNLQIPGRTTVTDELFRWRSYHSCILEVVFL
jgi:MFS family permease